MLEWKMSRPDDIGTLYNGWTARQEIAARVYRSEDGRAWVAEVRLPAGRPNRIMAGFRTAKDAKAEAAAKSITAGKTSANANRGRWSVVPIRMRRTPFLLASWLRRISQATAAFMATPRFARCARASPPWR